MNRRKDLKLKYSKSDLLDVEINGLRYTFHYFLHIYFLFWKKLQKQKDIDIKGKEGEKWRRYPV